jgi:hypothetical protein
MEVANYIALPTGPVPGGSIGGREPTMPVQPLVARQTDPDRNKGAVEGDRPTDYQHYNRNASALGEDGLPVNSLAIAEDVIGANADQTQG